MLLRPRTWLPRTRFLMASTLAFTIGVSLSHCGNTVIGDDVNADAGTDQPKQLVSLTVSPDNAVLQVDVNQTVQRQYTVLANYSDGSIVDVSATATLMLENAAIGSLAGTTFTSAASATAKVGFSKVLASYTENGQTQTGYANLTVVWLRMTGTATDFFYNLPFMAAAQDQPLQFGTTVQSLDSFFAVDTTGSMGPEIQTLNTSLTNTIIPGVKAGAAKDAQFGVAAVEDYPVSPFGGTNVFPGNIDDQPLIMLQNITPDVAAAQTAVGKLLNGTKPRGYGVDVPEGQMEALYQLATGTGSVVGGVVNIPANKTGIGGAGFRKGALPVITMISDAVFHAKGEAGTCSYSGFTDQISYNAVSAVNNVAHTRTQTVDALNQICAKVIGVSAIVTTMPVNCLATADLVKMANATGAVVPPSAWDIPSRPAGCSASQCCTGQSGVGEAPDVNGMCPLVFKIPSTGAGLGAQVVSGISNVARFSQFNVTTQTTGNPTGDMGEALPAGKSTADFITAITPKDSSAPPAPPTLPGPVIAGNAFTKVYPGSTVRFTVTATNTLVQPTAVPQVFRAKIKVLAGGCADLDEREVIILVPPKAPVVG